MFKFLVMFMSILSKELYLILAVTVEIISTNLIVFPSSRTGETSHRRKLYRAKISVASFPSTSNNLLDSATDIPVLARRSLRLHAS